MVAFSPSSDLAFPRDARPFIDRLDSHGPKAHKHELNEDVRTKNENQPLNPRKISRQRTIRGWTDRGHL